MIIEIIEDIENVLPKFVLKNDDTLLAESSSQKTAGQKEAFSKSQETFIEGAIEILMEKKRQKRNVELRAKAIEHYGFDCYVCGINFENKYGDYGAGYIELHHLDPLAGFKGERESTVLDVRVVCSNCHSILHHQGRVPMDVDELKAFVKARSSK